MSRLRRSDAISDRDILLTLTGMLCNARTGAQNAEHLRVKTRFSYIRLDRGTSFGVLLCGWMSCLQSAFFRCCNFEPIAFERPQVRQIACVLMFFDFFGHSVSPLNKAKESEHKISIDSLTLRSATHRSSFISSAEGYMSRIFWKCDDRRQTALPGNGTPEFIGECVEKLKALGLKGSCLIRRRQRQRQSVARRVARQLWSGVFHHQTQSAP